MAIFLNKTDKDFVDVSLSFEATALTGDITLLRNERAINNAIRNIVYTIPMEVVFQRDIGSGVTGYMFDFIDEGTAGLLNIEIKRTIKFNEPRAEVLSVEVNPRIYQNAFECTIVYKIIGYEQEIVLKEILTPTR